MNRYRVRTQVLGNQWLPADGDSIQEAVESLVAQIEDPLGHIASQQPPAAWDVFLWEPDIALVYRGNADPHAQRSQDWHAEAIAHHIQRILMSDGIRELPAIPANWADISVTVEPGVDSWRIFIEEASPTGCDPLKELIQDCLAEEALIVEITTEW